MSIDILGRVIDLPPLPSLPSLPPLPGNPQGPFVTPPPVGPLSPGGPPSPQQQQQQQPPSGVPPQATAAPSNCDPISYDPASGVPNAWPEGCTPGFPNPIKAVTDPIVSTLIGAKGFFDFIGRPQNVLFALGGLILLAAGSFALFAPEIKETVKTMAKVIP